jgi:hypothetical protein
MSKKKKKRITKSETLTTEIVDVVHRLPAALLQDKVVGLSVEEATKLVEEAKKVLRITREDNNYSVGDCMYDLNRLNVEVEKGLVVKAAIG